MKTNDSGKHIGTLEKLADNKQIHIVVNGHKVKLSFPPKSESAVVNDIKRMILGGVVKT